MKGLKTVKITYSIMSVCLIVLGLIFIIDPRMSLGVLCKISGAVLIGYGIVKFAGYFTKDLFQLAFQFDLALGIVSVVFGLALLFKTNNVIEILSISIGIFMLVDSTLKIQTAIDAKRFGVDKWWLILVMSLVVAVIGILLLIEPFTATDIVMIIIGLNFCLDGILNLIVVQSTVKTIRRNQKWEI